MTEILYRKWRPTRFDEVAGQENVTTTLKNALATDRVAHAYLLSGSRGTGKTSTGRLLAKALNCTDRLDGEPCNQCESCQAFLAGRSWNLIEMDAASNRGIDDIRDLRSKVAQQPGSAGSFKVYLIDEVHMLTPEAFNALLKTLEEPPPHAVFILATTEAHKLPATIASRCQRFDFKRIPLAAAIARLQTICEGENIKAEPEALELIARQATGSLRDGTNLLDQLATSYGGDLTVERVRAGLGLIADDRVAELARVSLHRDLAAGLTIISAVRDDGLDLRQFQKELVDELRDLLMVKSGLPPEEGATEERLQAMREAVADIPTSQVLTALKAFGEADLKQDPNSTLPLDIALAACTLAGEFAENSIKQSNTQSPAPTSPTPQAPRAEALAGRTSAPASPARPHPAEAPTSPSPSTGRGPGGGVSPTPEAPEPPPWLDDVPPLGEPAPEPAARPEAPSPQREPVSAPTAREAPPAPPSQPAPETPAPEPAPAAPSAPAGSSLTESRAAMRPIYEKAKAVGFQLGALLNGGCDIIQADEASIVFGFRHEFHAVKASEQKNLEALTRIAGEVLGRSVSVRCEVAEDVIAWTQRESTSRGRDNPLVRAAQEMGAQVVQSSGPGPEE